jgi:hypothetical protein
MMSSAMSSIGLQTMGFSQFGGGQVAVTDGDGNLRLVKGVHSVN